MDKILLNLLSTAFGRNLITATMMVLVAGNVGLAYYVAKINQEHKIEREAIRNEMLEIERKWALKFETELRQQIEITKEALRRQTLLTEQVREIKMKFK